MAAKIGRDVEHPRRRDDRDYSSRHQRRRARTVDQVQQPIDTDKLVQTLRDLVRPTRGSALGSIRRAGSVEVERQRHAMASLA